MIAQCEQCPLTYQVDEDGCPVTIEPFTCDDCGGSVEVLTSVSSQDLT